VRNLEAGRVRSPHTATVRLLADALKLRGPERGSWFEAARGVNHQRGGTRGARAGGPMLLPGDARARQPLTACGFGMGNSPTRRRSSTAEFQAEIVELCQRDDGSTGRVAKDADQDQTPARAWTSRSGPDGSATCQPELLPVYVNRALSQIATPLPRA
jgi:hypothetical protein